MAVVAPAPVAVVEVDSEPPPAQREVIVERPGMIWIDGHWNWEGRWVWHPGYHERLREGYRWERGHYGARHVWVEGHWAR